MKRLIISPIIIMIVLLISAACTARQPAVTQDSASTQDTPAEHALVAPAKTETSSKSITVLAAASLVEPFNEIGREFESQYPGVKVVFSFAGSQQLAQQLDQGASADVFASASEKYMDAAVQSGRVTDGTAKVFANNRLVVIYPKDNPAGLQRLQDLAKPGLKLVLAAKEVPVGQYSLDFMDKAVKDPVFSTTFKDDVLKNVVSYEDNVKSVLAKVVLGEADAGIVYLSDISAEAASKVGKLGIPDPLNVIATYPIAVINNSRDPDLAKAFMDLVLSPAGQKVLGKYNFIPAAQ